MSNWFAHETAVIDEPCQIGEGTKIWHYCHIMKNARIGKNCILGQNVFVGEGVIIGDNVKIQNNVSVYSGVTIEDDVFLGPSCVLTNVKYPRSKFKRDSYGKTIVRKGATIGANATILCGIELGSYCFVGAGAVVTKSVSDHVLVIGNPAKEVGHVSIDGRKD